MGSICSNADHTKNEEKSEIKTSRGSKSGTKDKASKNKQGKAAPNQEIVTKKKKKPAKGAKVQENTQTTLETAQATIQDEYDENDINTMLPKEPTLNDANGDKDQLAILLQARETLIALWDLKDNHDWKFVKENKEGQTLWKGKPETSTEFLIKRHMIVDKSLDETTEIMRKIKTHLQAHPKMESLDVVQKINTDCRVSHQIMNGNAILSSRDLCVAE